MSEAVAEVKAPEKIDLDMLDSSMTAETIELNADVNPMDAPAPVEDGVRRYKLFGADNWEQCETRPGKTDPFTYYKTQFYGVCIEEGTPNNNKRVFGRVNTITFDGKNEMAFIILQALGGKNNPEAKAYVESLKSHVDLAKAFKRILSGNPIIQIETKWKARHNFGTKDEPDYRTVLSGMVNFPKNPDGTYRHIVNQKGVGEVVAQPEIQDYFPDK